MTTLSMMKSLALCIVVAMCLAVLNVVLTVLLLNKQLTRWMFRNFNQAYETVRGAALRWANNLKCTLEWDT